MKSARNQLILLGLVCQGFSLDDIVLPSLNILIWILCLTLPRKPLNFGSTGESLWILFGIAVGYGVSGLAGVSSHFAIGHGVTMIQVVRLMRPLSQREKIISMIAAFIHLGVGYVVMLDYRFLLIFGASLILIPRALAETAGNSVLQPSEAPVRIGWMSYGWILAFTIAIFLFFPRNFFGTPLSTHRAGKGDEGTLADTIMDPSSSPLGGSNRILMQIEGEEVGYLRCIALDRFDGRVWTADPHVQYRWSDYDKGGEDLDAYRYRRVRVKNVGYLSKVLPMDGDPSMIKGKFFRNLRTNIHGIVSAIYMWNTSNNLFEYWTRIEPRPVRIRSEFKDRLLYHPEPSSRLRSWLDHLIADVEGPFEQAKFMEAYFQDHFSYKLGAPELNRLNPVDDFIFNQREGHCERYASALTLLLRMQGIPARVMVGYVPGSRSWFSKGYNVRFKDAHAWTEAWFEDRGWQTLDATPRASMPPDSDGIRVFMEGLEFAWYLHVVNFGTPTQKMIFEGLGQSIQDFGGWVRSNKRSLVTFVVATSSLVFFVILGFAWMKKRTLKLKRTKAFRYANHLYGRMLKILAKKGFPKTPELTPLEYLSLVKESGRLNLEEIELVTRVFCRSRYGHETLTVETKKELESALARIMKSR